VTVVRTVLSHGRGVNQKSQKDDERSKELRPIDFHQDLPGPKHALGTVGWIDTAPITSRSVFPENEESEYEMLR
jgi:hypothetical protein